MQRDTQKTGRTQTNRSLYLHWRLDGTTGWLADFLGRWWFRLASTINLTLATSRILHELIMVLDKNIQGGNVLGQFLVLQVYGRKYKR